jgi:signal peptidase I
MEPTTERAGFVWTFARVCFFPGAFFRADGTLEPRAPMVPFFLLVHALNAVVLTGVLVVQEEDLSAALLALPVMMVWRLVYAVAEVYLYGSLVGVAARWLGGKGTLEGTREIFAYATAVNLFAFPPYVEWLVRVWWLALVFFAVARHHQLKKSLVAAAAGLPLLAPFLLGVPAALVLRLFVIEAFKIPAGSMAPTFVPGDHVFVQKRAYGWFSKSLPHRGDAVVFRYPNPDPTAPPADFIKRVVGLPGDEIRTENERLVINGWKVPACSVGKFSDPDAGMDLDLKLEFLGEAAYLVAYTEDRSPDTSFRVPPGEFFVLGDNRDNSADSRIWNGGRGGGVPIDNLKGKANLIWWRTTSAGRSLWHDATVPELPKSASPPLQAAFAACMARRPSLSATTPPPYRPRTEPPPVPDEQKVVDAALAEEPGPAAVVVLAIEGEPSRLVALGRHKGADPVTQALRPGSTVKPLMGWIAAEASVLSPGETLSCRGTYDAERGLKCFETHGDLDLTRSITTSCNSYYFELGKRLGLERVSRGLTAFGLARPTGLVPGEAAGFIATPAWAAEQADKSKSWELAVAAGHGALEVTLLQLAVAYGDLARRLNALSDGVSGGVPEAVRREIARGLLRVVTDEKGTGRGAFVPGLAIAGKTGTAEGGSFEDQRRGAPEKPENGWFVGFAPASTPKMVVAAVVHGQGPGGKRAAPLVGRIFARLEPK